MLRARWRKSSRKVDPKPFAKKNHKTVYKQKLMKGIYVRYQMRYVLNIYGSRVEETEIWYE